MKKLLMIIMILTALYKVTSSQTSNENNAINIAGDVSDKAKKNFELYQNSPKEFKEITAIKFHLYKEGKVKLYVSDVNGNLTETLAEGIMDAGQYYVYYKAYKGLASGVYKYTLEVDGISQSKEMILIN